MKMFTPFILAGTMSLPVLSMDGTTFNMVDRDGIPLGKVTLTEMAKGTKIALDLKNIQPGEHAIHFHEKGECLGPDFKTAGDHFSPKPKEHGLKNKKGPHAGDMKNITVGTDGIVKTEFINPRVNLKSGDNSLMRAGGTALIIHAKADDGQSQPAGDSGDRVACAVIK